MGAYLLSIGAVNTNFKPSHRSKIVICKWCTPSILPKNMWDNKQDKNFIFILLNCDLFTLIVTIFVIYTINFKDLKSPINTELSI